MFYLLIIGLVVGVVIGILGSKFLERRTKTTGTIQVSKGDEKIVYSLELDENPEEIATKKKVLFRVETLDRT